MFSVEKLKVQVGLSESVVSTKFSKIQGNKPEASMIILHQVILTLDFNDNETEDKLELKLLCSFLGVSARGQVQLRFVSKIYLKNAHTNVVGII
jgi:hypothetical protein